MLSSRLTFGVEFEFSLASIADNVEDPLPKDGRQVKGLRPRYERWDINRTRYAEDIDRKVKKTVAKKFREAGLPTITTMDPEDHEINNLLPWAGGNWVITTDSTIRPPVDLDKDHDWWKIEVNSPPYIFCQKSLDAVLLACRILTSTFRTNVNESCGLHVHVGNGDNNFDFDTLRNLLAFFWCFEPVIDTLHPPARIHNQWCRSIRRSSRLAGALHAHRKTNIDVLRHIFAEPDFARLMHLLGEDDATTKEAYYMGNLEGGLVTWRERKVTLEFRQHEGTLDGARAVAWVQTVVGFFEFVADCDRFYLADFLVQHAEIEDAGGEMYDIEDLLRDMRLKEPADFYASRPHLS